MAESEEELKSFLMKVKEESEKVGLKLHIQKTNIMASGAITSFLDRAFYGKSAKFALKPAAAVVSCRRGGASAAFDQLNKYFTISQMIVVGSQYWNQIHGNTPEEALCDEEGLQTMRTLGRNMSWLLKSIESGKKAGIIIPEKETPVANNEVTDDQFFDDFFADDE